MMRHVSSHGRWPRPTPPAVDVGWSWVMFVAACVIHFMVFGLHYSYGVIFPRLLEEFHEGEGSTAWIGSIASGCLFLFSFLAVKMTEMTSVWFTCLIGSICAGGGLIFTSFSRTFVLLYVTHSALFGLGTSLLYTPSLIIIARSFVRWRSLTTGFVVAFGSLGQLVLSITLQVCLEDYGVVTTFRYLGVVFIAVTVSCSCLFIPLNSVTAGNGVLQRGNGTEKLRGGLRCDLFKNHAYLVWLGVMMLANYTYYIPLIYLVKYSRTVGASQAEGSYLLMGLAVASIVGRILFGKVSNTFPSYTVRIYQIGLFMTGACSLAASMATTYWHLVVYVAAYGLLDGSFIGLMSLVTLKIVGMRDLADGWGLMLCSIGIPAALGPATVGWINDSNALDHRAMFYLSGGPMVAGGLAMFYVIHKLKQCPQEKAGDPAYVWSSLIQCTHLDDEECLMQHISVV